MINVFFTCTRDMLCTFFPPDRQTGLIENSNALVTLGVKRTFFYLLPAKIGDYFSIYQVSDAWYCLFNLKVFAIVVR